VGVLLALGNGHGTPNPGASPGSTPAYSGVGDTAMGGQGQDVDGIKCEAQEQVAYHVHAHLFILRDGAPQPVAKNIGIHFAGIGTCIYWLHTHDASGIIHVESPTQRFYTLGQFFDIWGMPLSRNGVSTLDVPNGELTVFVDGTQYEGDPRDIQLKGHTQVVIELGKVVAPPPYDFGKL
jgi:hypothetical protein